MTTVDSTSPTVAESPQPSTDRDSIYWSKERWRIIAQRIGPMSIQYLLIDAHHNEIVATYPKMSEAMANRDRLDPVSSHWKETVAGLKCEEAAHE